MVISGTNFTPQALVSFTGAGSNVLAAVTLATLTQISAKVPTNAITGPITVALSATDPGTDSILLYIETVHDARRFISALRG